MEASERSAASAATEAVDQAPNGKPTSEDVPDLGTVPEQEPLSPEPEEVPGQQKIEAAIGEVDDERPSGSVSFQITDEQPLMIDLPEEDPPASTSFLMMGLENDDGQKSIALAEKLLGLQGWFACLRHMDALGYKTESRDTGFWVDPLVQTAIGKTVTQAARHYGITPGESEASPES